MISVLKTRYEIKISNSKIEYFRKLDNRQFNEESLNSHKDKTCASTVLTIKFIREAIKQNINIIRKLII